MKKGLISIIMPVYNGEKTLSRAIESCINQQYTNWELVVIDDNSEDGSISIINEYSKKDSRIILLKNNSGISGANSARDVGIRYSCGEFITFCDCDDYLLKESLVLRMNVFEKNPQVSMVYGNVYAKIDGIIYKWEYDVVTSKNQKKIIAEELSLCQQNAIMVRRSTLMNVGGLDKELCGWTDDALICSIAFNHGFAHCGDYVAMVTKKYSQMTKNKRNLYKGIKKLVNKYWKEILLYAGLNRLVLWKVRVIGALVYAKEVEAPVYSLRREIYHLIYQRIKRGISPYFRRYFE